MLKVKPVILAGGTGSRLWPVSRESYPKQFHTFLGEHSLFQQTIERLNGFDENPIIITQEEHRFVVAEQLRLISKSSESILLEPCPRSTAPAVALAAFEALSKGDEDVLLLVLSSDHTISDLTTFNQAIQVGIKSAEKGNLVVFGVEPTRPETGYGYIRKGQDSKEGCFDVSAFKEKPNVALAEQYVKSKEYLWNSGIFLFKASVYLHELKLFEPMMHQKVLEAFQSSKKDGDFLRPDKTAFEDCPSNSIDYSVMEKTKVATVVPLLSGWSDIGTWSSLSDELNKRMSTPSSNGMLIKGDVIHSDCQNSFVEAHHRLVVTMGISNAIVVETNDAVLIMDKSKSEAVKNIVSQLKLKSRKEAVFHSKVNRPWGSFESINEGSRFQVKRITVDVGKRLSLQLHHHRSEHWVVVVGTAKVTRGDETFILSENQSTYIPIGVPHRLENVGKIPLEIIEVQSGSYLGEDDIIRLDDEYGRIKESETLK